MSRKVTINRERIAEITLYELLTEDFVEPAANFYMTSENRESFYTLWRQFKKTLAGYTRQPKAKISPYEIPHAAYDKYFTPPEPNPTSLDELKVPPAEPAEDKVEAIAKLLYFKAGGDGWEKEHEKPKHYLDLGKEQFRKTAREIIKLCQPELKVLETNPYPNAEYPNADKWLHDGYELGKSDQLAHDQKRITGGYNGYN